MQEGPEATRCFQDGRFGNTDWWVVSRAGSCDRPEADPARARLCAAYWKPVFNFIRQKGYGHEDAEDLTQEFFARILERNSLRTAAKEKGKFRSFLLTLLKRFLADQRDRAHSQKRGGGRPLISFDSFDTEFRRRHEPVDRLDPETVCERTWAHRLLDAALRRLQQECVAKSSTDVFNALKPLILCEREKTYAGVANDLHLTESNVKVQVHRLRRRFRELLRQAVERSASGNEQIEAELRDVLAVLTG